MSSAQMFQPFYPQAFQPMSNAYYPPPNQALPVSFPTQISAPIVNPQPQVKSLPEAEVLGSGPIAQKGHRLMVHYKGTLAETGTQFDNSYERGTPFEFQLGAGEVIKGWDEGVAGMRVGGKRTLIIPPEYGYGKEGAPPDIPPNATLKFEVELVGVQ